MRHALPYADLFQRGEPCLPFFITLPKRERTARFRSKRLSVATEVMAFEISAFDRFLSAAFTTALAAQAKTSGDYYPPPRFRVNHVIILLNLP